MKRSKNSSRSKSSSSSSKIENRLLFFGLPGEKITYQSNVAHPYPLATLEEPLRGVSSSARNSSEHLWSCQVCREEQLAREAPSTFNILIEILFPTFAHESMKCLNIQITGSSFHSTTPCICPHSATFDTLSMRPPPNLSRHFARAMKIFLGSWRSHRGSFSSGRGLSNVALTKNQIYF